jgi:drug/metabolite transporter (DMT)-like permease
MWGLHFSIIKIASQSGLAHSGIASFITISIAAVRIVIAAVRGKWPVFNKKTIVYYFVCSVLGYLVPFLVSINVAKHLPASVLAVVISTTPIWTTLITWLGRFDVVLKRHIWGISLGFLAASILLLPGASVGSAQEIWWIIPAFAIPVAYAIYHIFVGRYWPEGSDSFQVAGGKEIIAALIVLPIYIGSGDYITFADWSKGAWIIPMMVCFALVGVFLYFEVNRIAGAIFVSQANFVTVVAGIVAGWLIFDEQVTIGLAFSVVLLLGSLWLTRRTH